MSDLGLQALYVLVGALTGFIIGCSGVGGAALMTPSLMLLGVDPIIAVGTDLIFSFITKSAAFINYYTQKNIEWLIVKKMCLGSMPGTLMVLLILYCIHDLEKINHLITLILGYILFLVAFILILNKIAKKHFLLINNRTFGTIKRWINKHVSGFTVAFGFLIGIVVTLTSIGAGSIGVILIYLLYNHLPATKIVGTDITQALLITFIAGIGHGFRGNIDYGLLFLLLSGSIPVVLLASHYVRYMPEKFIGNILIIVLTMVGLKFIFY